ncbi:MAG: DUF1189 family protein [Lachnospiraceae bacterium]|nr:DUF1189 family protein [Lachnospiraceae bacterium]
MTFAEQIVYAMFKPSRFKELIDLKKGRFAVFVIVLMLAIGIVREIIPEAAFIVGFGGFESLFTEKMAPFNFNDGELSIEKPFTMSVSMIKIMIDTEEEKISDTKLDRTGEYIAFGSKYLSIVLKENSKYMRYRDIKLADILPDGFSNATLKSLIPFIYFYLILNYLLYCGGCFIKYAILALIFSISAGSINRIANIGLTKGEIFRLCFYGQTLGIIISNFNAALGLFPSMFVSFVCVILSISMINSGLRHMDKSNQI